MSQMVLITNNASQHSAEDWAAATASHIVDIADHVAGTRRAAAIKLQAALIDQLTAMHEAVQAGAKASPGAELGDIISISGAVTSLVDAAKGTPWEADFAGDFIADHLRSLLISHFQTAIAIERAA